MPAQHIRRDPESQADFLAAVAAEAQSRAATRSLAEALTRGAAAHGVALVAEVKRRSPSAGSLRERLDPADLTRAYAAAGASAVSVLTEPRRFGGSLADLERAAAAVDVPVLRKDFLVEPAQVLESREAGADAVLLIARLLGPDRLRELLTCATEAGLEALVEAHSVEEVAHAVGVGARVVGVNNRDLSTLSTDLARSFQVAREARERGVSWPAIAVSESGIRTRDEVLELARAGFRAVLVGESLLRAADPARAVRALLGTA
jgi:indole-3-glycerol phosphate synthase